MSLTVVTTRDYDNVPTCFEKYELGTLWRLHGGNLEIFAGRTLVALYPSGNWISVYADDAMQVHKGSAKPDYSTMPTVDVGRSPTSPDVATAQDDPDGTRRAATTQPVDSPWTRPDDVRPLHDDSVPISEQQIVPEADVTAARAAMMPVAFRPRRYRAAPPPAKKAPTGPRMLPVRLRLRPARGATDTEAATADTTSTADPTRPRMMPVAMRTTIYRAARHLRPEIEPPEPEHARDDDGTDGTDEPRDR